MVIFQMPREFISHPIMKQVTVALTTASHFLILVVG
jgi:hypothetical protein